MFISDYFVYRKATLLMNVLKKMTPEYRNIIRLVLEQTDTILAICFFPKLDLNATNALCCYLKYFIEPCEYKFKATLHN